MAGAQAVHVELTAKAADTRLHPPQPAQLDRIRAPMLLNAAYLAFDAADSVTFTAPRSRTRQPRTPNCTWS